MEKKFEFNWHGQNNWAPTDSIYKHVHWESILDAAKRLNKGQDCDFEGERHAGGQSVVRRIRFRNTGEHWLVKVPNFIGWWAGHEKSEEDALKAWHFARREEFKSEIATMRIVAESSKIPVPAIYGYNIDVKGNPAKLPYILMQCLEGNILYEHPNYKNRSDAQQAKIEKIGAWLQHQFSEVTTSTICTINEKEDGSFYEAPAFGYYNYKPEEVMRGPYSSVSEYLVNWAKVWRNIKRHDIGRKHPGVIKNDKPLADFPTMLITSIQKPGVDQFLEYYGKGGYCLVHGDFSYHNHLYNDDFDLVGVIDFDRNFTAPWPLAVGRTVLELGERTRTPVLERGPVIKPRYAEELRKIESPNKRLSEVYSHPLGEIGLAMHYFEQGCRGPDYSEILMRLDHAIKVFKDAPPPSSSWLVTDTGLDKVE